MSGKAFFDTNIFVYSYDRREPVKQSVALNLIREATFSGDGVISYQVVQEFFNVVLVKSQLKMRHEDAQKFLATVFLPLVSVPWSIGLMSAGIRIQERYHLSWYDSLIVAAAQQAGCSVLYSEDFQHGQKFGTVLVRNPFL
jgi:predicted nucleic acid-binding protein